MNSRIVYTCRENTNGNSDPLVESVRYRYIKFRIFATAGIETVASSSLLVTTMPTSHQRK